MLLGVLLNVVPFVSVFIFIISSSLSVKHAFLSSDYASALHQWSEPSLTQHQV